MQTQAQPQMQVQKKIKMETVLDGDAVLYIFKPFPAKCAGFTWTISSESPSTSIALSSTLSSA